MIVAEGEKRSQQLKSGKACPLSLYACHRHKPSYVLGLTCVCPCYARTEGVKLQLQNESEGELIKVSQWVCYDSRPSFNGPALV